MITTLEKKKLESLKALENFQEIELKQIETINSIVNARANAELELENISLKHETELSKINQIFHLKNTEKYNKFNFLNEINSKNMLTNILNLPNYELQNDLSKNKKTNQQTNHSYDSQTYNRNETNNVLLHVKSLLNSTNSTTNHNNGRIRSNSGQHYNHSLVNPPVNSLVNQLVTNNNTIPTSTNHNNIIKIDDNHSFNDTFHLKKNSNSEYLSSQQQEQQQSEQQKSSLQSISSVNENNSLPSSSFTFQSPNIHNDNITIDSSFNEFYPPPPPPTSPPPFILSNLTSNNSSNEQKVIDLNEIIRLSEVYKKK